MDGQVQAQSPATATKSLLEIPGISNRSRSRESQDSNLLTTLTPEAFKRVSTALDEVFGLIALENSPVKKDNKRLLGAVPRTQRSSIDSDTNSFTSALTHVRAVDSRQASHEMEQLQSEEEDEAAADRTITGPQPTLDAVHIEQGRLALHSPLASTLPVPLPETRNKSVTDLPTSPAATQLSALATSDSTQTVMETSKDKDLSSAQASSTPRLNAGPSQHLSVSGHSVAESSHTRPSDRSSVVTATEAQQPSSRIVSTASTIEVPRHGRDDPPSTASRPTSRPSSSFYEPTPLPYEAAMRPPEGSSAQRRFPRADRTPEMNSNAFFASPSRSTRSRGDSVISSSSVRSSVAGPTSGSYHGTHSRKTSADKLALARSMAPHPHLREQPSLSSVRRNYMQHVRSTTGSSEGSLLGGHASRRSSGAMSPPPMLSRSARSPNYFPVPASNVSMHDYASGFKPPSVVSPAAAAALHSMNNQASQSQNPSPMQNPILDASNALRSAQNVRNSASTGQSGVSPQVPSLAAFASGSDRAAATSSPETGTTSASLHHRNASLGSNKQLPQIQSSHLSSTDDGFSPSMFAPRPAPAPVVAQQPSPSLPAPSTTINERGLMPNPPSDPEQAEKWRAVYGIKAADAVSLRASAEDVSADPGEEEDLWARMASASDANKAERPVSNLPPSIAEERLAGTGITFDQIAGFQDRLIQNANGADIVPPLPRIQGDINTEQNKFAEAKSKGLASPNMVFGGSEWSKPPAPALSGDGLAFGASNGMSINTSHDAPLMRQSSSISQEPPVSPRAVMYDVTMSHRPTSPPLHSRNGSLNGLPSLLELNGSVGGHRPRESISLSQAVDQASRLPRQSAFRSPSNVEDRNSTIDEEPQYAVQRPVQQHPFNVGYTSPPLPPAQPYSGAGWTFPRDTGLGGGVGLSPKHQIQSELPEDVWDRFGPQSGRDSTDVFHGDSSGEAMNFLGSDPSRLLDDVAAQTSAATRALKGTDDGSVPTPPFRTKSISRKKSFKKVSKQISSPQLISTTQKLDHTTMIPPQPHPHGTPSTPGRNSKRSQRSPGWGSLAGMNLGTDSLRGHTKASPSAASQSGSVSRGTAYFHRRRSSSFGHEATPANESFGAISNTSGGSGPDTADASHNDRLTHPNHPYANGGANGGSLSRLFSKIKSRKNSEQGYGGATIEPFPAELSGGASQAPKTPEMPALPPAIERTTPWMLPRKASASSSSDRASSARSPTSPVYTLPIDSTSMPRKKGQKKRAPIVLKRDSEVIMPGDLGYTPTAIIGRSPEERAKDLPEVSQEDENASTVDSAKSEASNGLGLTVPQSAVIEPVTQQTVEATDRSQEEAPTERMDYLHSSTTDSLAPVAAVASLAADDEEDDEAITPKPREPSPVGHREEGSSVEEGDRTILSGAATSLPTPAPPVSAPVDSVTSSEQRDARKSLRDTIVRRTIIIPSGIDFSDNRRSIFSTRKSRRFAAAGDEPIPTSATPTTTSFDRETEAELPSNPVPASSYDFATADNNAEQKQQQYGEANGEGMTTFSSHGTLHPDRTNSRMSRVESSYAGSLYDYYINNSGSANELGSPDSPTAAGVRGEGDESSPAPALTAFNGARKSRMPAARHIEVTERADGSVVWQVIAGLSSEAAGMGRESIYSDFDPRHSRRFSEDLNEGEDDDDGAAPSGLWKTPAGLTDDDSRSFFTRPRQKISFDKNAALPLPTAGSGEQL